ncbi:MAG: hypothetical protein QG646_932 [Euryarchaeota archaeon]|nr:hypothetical protein [Euryarchaeota archaeon]
MVDVIKELEALRQNLLDLSLRNNLLNYRPSQKRTISITGNTLWEIYERFVLQEKSMRFRSKTRSRRSNKTEEGEEIEDDDQENEAGSLRTIEKYLSFEEKNRIPSSRSGAFLETPDDSETLDRKLFYVFNQANSIFEEQGYPVLYLAVGFLQWNEIKSSVKNPKAPLLLIPVELKRIGKGRNFTIQWTGDEIFTSITLQAKMKEFGIQIPDFGMPEEVAGVEEFFKSISKVIREKDNWIVLPEVYLDLFNFRKFVMYKDLDPATWPEDMSPADHPLIRKIFDPQDPESEHSGFLEEEVDLKLSAKDTYHIMDADSSQIAVIEDVKSGKDLVVEGPPGTGKSQTIANTIAELIAHGKSVLFVSEKMAALQVVKGRLDAAGLGELCLEIHSNQTRKKAVLEELEKILNRESPANISSERDINELEKLKHELNEYALSLREPAGGLYPSLYSLYGIREKIKAYFESKGMKMPRYGFQEPETWTLEAWTEAESVLEKLGQLLPTFGTARKNPWYGCKPGIVLPSDLGEIELLTEECAAAFQALEVAIKNLNELSATSRPNTPEEIESIINAAKFLLNSKPLPEQLLQNQEWESDSSGMDAETLVSRLRQYRELKTYVDRTFHPSIFKLDTSEFENLSHGFLKFINPRYRKLKKEIISYYISGIPSNDNRILLDLACISECEACRQELESAGTKGKKYFLDYWKGIESDPILLDEYCKLIPPLRKLLKENLFTDRIFKLVSSGIDDAALESAINELAAAKQTFLQSLEKVGNRIEADFGKMFGGSPETVKLSQLKSRTTRWKTETSSLVLWSQYLECQQACLETKAAPMLGDIEAGKIELCDMIPAFEGNYAELLLHRAFRKRPVLSTFIQELHEGKINKFADLDRKVLLENRKRIVCCAYEAAPKLTSGASRASEAGIVLNELNRKRGHMPIRALMKKAGGLIQKIKPCFLMSPLSIAQYLDPRSTRFDVIIFDEASQVRPEDAVGALLRGKQVVVMGDSKQLPPTDFFDAVLDSPEREPEDFAAAGDMESILNACKRSFPVKTLRWHYRSRHESLIAISNQEFYDNRLYVYPSPMQKDERFGLKFVHLPDSVYDRGKSGANRLEARAVAKAVFEHYRNYPDKSLGVGTFNIKQQEVIQEEIEALRKVNPGFDLSSKNGNSERFFVKNLETIQGDERDVIFLSVGFGFDSSRKLSLNFGPLNREGGERRLNVLITRAREKCVVFSNFTSRDLVLDENSSLGLRSLKIFLEFAESGKLPQPACSREDFASPFEEIVSNFLTENGCEVHRQIGCAGYRLDLAIPDPRNPGRYVLGIECDGKSYHSSRVARDRDRLRQQVLEGLGWKIYRVWSTDWYLHPKESKEKLLEATQEAIKQAKLQAKFNPEPEISPIKSPPAWDEPAARTSQASKDKDEDRDPKANKNHNEEFNDLPGGSLLPDGKFTGPLSPSSEPVDRISAGRNMEIKVGETLEAEFIETNNHSTNSFEAESEELYSGSPLEFKEELIDCSGEDFLPEMTSKAESMAQLADENSRKKPVRKREKSRLLKFDVDPSSEKINTFELIPEPEPEKINFYQAYPEIDFSTGSEQKRRRKRLNEFAYIYGSEGDFEPEPYPEEDNYTPGNEWNSKTEINLEPGTYADPKDEARLLKKNKAVEVSVPIYKTFPPSEFVQFGDLSGISDEKLEQAVTKIVKYEGPIHSDALLQRIKVFTGVPRMPGKTKQQIIDAAAHAETSGKIRIEGEFYWPTSGPECLLRRRDGDSSAKIEWICDEEIKEAVRFVLNSQYSTPLEDLIVQTARVLGIKSTRKNTWERIEKLVQSGIDSKELTLMPNEMIYFME